MDNIDVAIIVTITEYEQRDLMNDNIRAKVELKETLKGIVKPEFLSEGIMLKDGITVGDTYLLLLNSDGDGNLFLSSREGSIVNVKDSSYANYSALLK